MRRGVFGVRDPASAASTMRAVFDGLMMQWLAETDPEATFSAYRERCERELLRYLVAGSDRATKSRREGSDPLRGSAPVQSAAS